MKKLIFKGKEGEVRIRYEKIDNYTCSFCGEGEKKLFNSGQKKTIDVFHGYKYEDIEQEYLYEKTEMGSEFFGFLNYEKGLDGKVFQVVKKGVNSQYFCAVATGFAICEDCVSQMFKMIKITNKTKQ